MIIDRYLIREVVQPFWAIFLTLIIIFVTFSLGRYMVTADAGLLQLGEVLHLTFLKLVISLEILLPLSLYLAVITGLGRLYTDSEIYALRAGGVSEARLLRPVMRLTLILALLVATFSILARPWAYSRSYTVRAAAEASAEIGRIKQARFYTFGKDRRTVFIKHIASNGTGLDGVFIRSRKGDDIQVITASTGVFSYFKLPGFHQLRLSDARIFRKVADGTDISAKFGTLSLWLPVEAPKDPGYKVKSTGTLALIQSDDPGDKAELQWRLSTPVSALLLALLAIPLSRSQPRQGRYAKLILAVVVYAIYANLLDISRSWVQQGSLGYIWWVPGILLLVVLVLYSPVKFRARGQADAHD